LDGDPQDLNNKQLEIYFSTDDIEYAADILAEEQLTESSLLIGLNPGIRKGAELKGWPIERYAGLCDRIIDEYNGKILIFGSKQDIPFAKRIESLMHNKPFVLAGRTTLRQSAALIKRCDVFVTADTGPMHIAFAVNTPTVALFGPTNPGILASSDLMHRIVIKDVGCNPCYLRGPFPACSEARCMKAITVDDVIEKIENVYSDAVLGK